MFLAAILPQFTSRADADVAPQILVLGLLFAGIAVLSDTVWAILADGFRAWFARRLELVGGAGGLAIAAVGVGVLATGRKD